MTPHRLLPNDNDKALDQLEWESLPRDFRMPVPVPWLDAWAGYMPEQPLRVATETTRR